MSQLLVRLLGPTLKRSPPTSARRYGFALVLLAVAFLLRFSLQHVMGQHHPYLFFIPAALAAGWYGRFGPAMLVLGAGYLLGDLVFQTPRFELGPYTPDTLVTILTYAVITLIGTGIFEAFHRTRDRLELAQQYNDALEKEIREREQVQHALQQSELEYRLLFESNPLPTYVWAKANFKFLAVNEAAIRHYGYSREEFLDMSILDIRPAAEISKLKEHVRQKTEDLEFAGIWRHRKKDGTLIQVEITTHPLKFGGQDALLVLANDVTERLHAEQIVREAQARLENHAQELEKRVAERTASLEASLKSLEGVLYHVAHDLRAPLRAMNGFTHLLLKSCSDPNDCQAHDFACRIKESSEMMDAKIQDLLEYGRLGHKEVNCQNLDLSMVVKEVLRRHEDQITTKNANITVEHPLPYVWADNAVMEQVFACLLENALCFVRSGFSPQVRIWAEQQNNLVRLFIQDNGIGIAPEYHERIFGIFEQLHQPGTYPGTGIGLAIAKKGAERMGGHIGLKSQPGEGSCFWAELRAALAGQAQAA